MQKYKPSNYNHFIFLEDENKYMVYNSISNGLAKLEPEIFYLLKKGKEGILEIENDDSKKELCQKLYSGNIIIDNDLDEIKFLSTKFNMSKYGQKNLSLTIVTTLDCNLDCVYCYEGNRSKVYADSNREEEILKFASEKIKSMGYKSLSVVWYGGEPLLNKQFIVSLSKKLQALCKSERVQYNAIMVTNGTMLNKTTVKELKRLKVNGMQITIDGPSEIQDKRRPLKNIKKSSYQLIMKNVESVLGIIPIQVRINVDKTNSSSTILLLEEFERKGWLKRNGDISVYIGYTRDWTSNCSNILPDCFSMKEFTEAEIEFHKLLISKGINVSNLYPSPQGFCVAVSPHGFVIDPGGEIHKCWSEVGNKEAYVGTIKEPLKLNTKLLEWLSYNPLEDSAECRECNLFPVCGGGCPYVMIRKKDKLEKDKTYNCTPWKIFMEDKIRLFLLSKAMKLEK